MARKEIVSIESVTAGEPRIRPKAGRVRGGTRSSRDVAGAPDHLPGIEFLPDATFAIDRQKRVIAWNMAIEEMTGIPRDEIMGKGNGAYARAFYHQPRPMLVDLVELPQAEIEARYGFVERRGRTLCAEAYVPGVFGGRGAHLWATACPLFNRAGEQIGSIESLREITERKETEDRLRQTNKNLMLWVDELEKRNRESTLLKEMGESLQTCVNTEGAYEVLSRYVQQLLPGDAGALYILSDSKHLLEAVAVWGPSHSSRLFTPDACCSLKRGRVHEAGNGLTQILCSHVKIKDGTRYVCIPLASQGEVLGMLYLQGDSGFGAYGEDEKAAQTRRRLGVSLAEHGALALANLRLRETLRHQAIRDPLTGLYNRRYMEESLERELSRAVRRNVTLGVVMFDLDHFKRFNDTFGHAAGDMLLRELGALLNKTSRGEDLACRYGGEEFTLILVEACLNDVVVRANQLREAVKHLAVRHQNQPLGAVTVSVGISVFPLHGMKTEDLLLAADAALYRAKAVGRDRVCVA